MVLALTMAIVVVWLLLVIWKIFGTFVALAFPMFFTGAENETAVRATGADGADVAPPCRSGSFALAATTFVQAPQLFPSSDSEIRPVFVPEDLSAQART
jgi:hypothetical protein